MKRKEPLITENTYHIMNKSIAKYKIFNTDNDFTRMIKSLYFFSFNQSSIKFSQFLKSAKVEREGFIRSLKDKINGKNRLVKIIAYCIMPTHFHLILKQKRGKGISKYIGKISNSHAKFFNNKYNRQGRLWQDKFKNVLVDSDEQLLHLTRYIHLNPTTAGLVKDPGQWIYSSYNEYINNNPKIKICNFKNLIEINPKKYKKFVNARKDYQRKLAKIKNLIIE